jgi:hypothetical protein
MRWALIGLLTLHGLIHLMGFAKAFGDDRNCHSSRSRSPVNGECCGCWRAGLVAGTAVMLAAGARTTG